MSRNTSKAVQQYRGTTAQHAGYTGAAGELTVDTDKKTVVVQDGVTAGGNPVALEKRRIVSATSYLKVNGGASGTLAQDTTLSVDNDELTDAIPVFIPGSVSFAGRRGLVPAPAAVDPKQVLRGNALWDNVAECKYLELPQGHTYTEAQIKAMVDGLNLTSGSICVVYEGDTASNEA